MKLVKLLDGTNVVIREGNKSDAKKMLDFINRVCIESDNLTFGEGEFGINLEQEEQFLENVSKQTNALFLIAEFDGDIIGNLNFTGGRRPRIAHTGEFGVSVIKDYWGLGLGMELINYLIHWAKDNGLVRKINLRVRSDNNSAIHVYKKLGFNIEGTITRDLKVDGILYDCFHMGLEID